MSYQEFARPAQEASWGFSFAHRLTTLLRKHNIKSAQFARKTGIPKSAIDSYMEGRSIPNYYRMMLMADALGITVEKLADIRPFADLDDLEDDEDEEADDVDCESEDI